MTANDRSMPSPATQRYLHEVAARVQNVMAACAFGDGTRWLLDGGDVQVTVTAMHRYSAECLVEDGFSSADQLTILVPLPKENWP